MLKNEHLASSEDKGIGIHNYLYEGKQGVKNKVKMALMDLKDGLSTAKK